MGTVIIHCAWVLDFNKSLYTFESHIRGTRNLIDLARSRTVPVHLFHRDQSKGPLPEELQLDAGVAVGNGHGESEYVFERIFAASSLSATSFRIGQIGVGSSAGQIQYRAGRLLFTSKRDSRGAALGSRRAGHRRRNTSDG
ncbi:hypothetical protein C8F01DRAFT_574708 [Mycena amicta]|nr:hypothetical protein C8F01DRAFT_574708 [Mycena amicta]